MIQLDFSGISLKLRQDEDKTRVFDPIRKRWIVLTPEEHVRQYLLQFMLCKMHYPAGLIAVEKKIVVGKITKRYDIVVYNRSHTPWMLVECKEPEVSIDEKTLHQLLSYHSTIQCSYWMLTNGHQTFCADAKDKGEIIWLASLPAL